MTEEDSDREFSGLVGQIETWNNQFIQTPFFARLTATEQEAARDVTGFFAEYTYSYLGLIPQKWDRAGVRECCLDILPRKMSAERSFFAAIAPVLSAFFSFLAERAVLANGEALSKFVAGLDREIVANSQDSTIWGPAKALVMEAQAAGIDLTDSAAMEAFISEQNRKLAS